MFTSARFKLTAWYLLIIMIISGLFSVVVYRGLTGEIDRVVRMQEVRNQTGEQVGPFRVVRIIDPELIKEAKQRIFYALIVVNGWIFIIAGGAGYFLAGRTLKPIEEMVYEQQRFISDASHELRTPLTALRTEIEVGLRDKTLTIRQARSLLESNLEEVKILQSLSQHLLTLVRYNHTDENSRYTSVLVSEATEQAVKTVSALAKKKNMTVTTDVKDVLIKGDKDRLWEVFVILLDNAIKYGLENSTITISSRLSNQFVSLDVRNQGEGIKASNIPYIFDRFYRVDVSRNKKNTSGFGLGLAIAKKIVQEHDGQIKVKSTPGKVTVFTVQLPIAS